MNYTEMVLFEPACFVWLDRLLRGRFRRRGEVQRGPIFPGKIFSGVWSNQPTGWVGNLTFGPAKSMVGSARLSTDGIVAELDWCGCAPPPVKKKVVRLQPLYAAG